MTSKQFAVITSTRVAILSSSWELLVTHVYLLHGSDAFLIDQVIISLVQFQSVVLDLANAEFWPEGQ